MILFLQSSAKLSTCYSYIGVALRAALRLGMHRSLVDNFNPIEAESRKRVFWAIRMMDTYVGATLGLPHTLHDDDIDQDFPVEVDDEFIRETVIDAVPQGYISLMSAFNHHIHLVRILSKIVKNIYPIKGAKTSHKNNSGNRATSYSVNYAKIFEIETDLQEWKEGLPVALRPGGEGPPRIVRYSLRPSNQYRCCSNKISQFTTPSPNGLCPRANDALSTVPSLCLTNSKSRSLRQAVLRLCRSLCERLTQYNSHNVRNETKGAFERILLV